MSKKTKRVADDVGVVDDDLNDKNNKRRKHADAETEANVEDSSSHSLQLSDVVKSRDLSSTVSSGDQGTKSVKFGLADILSVEHAVNNLQNALKTILTTAVDEEQLEQYKREEVESLEALMALQRSKITLAAMLKTLYNAGKLQIFDQITNFEELHGSLFTKEKVSLNVNAKAENSDEEIDNDDDDDLQDGQLPPLPPINDPAIRARVFLHKSLVKDKQFISGKEAIHTHNERLEFIGDSILNYIMSQICYNAFPDATEGEISQLRSKLISNATLQEWSVKYGFDQKLKIHTDDSIFNGKLKVYADVFEAYIGGLLTESPDNYTVAYRWLKKLAQPILKRGLSVERNKKSPKALNLNAKVELYSLIGYAGLGLQYKTIHKEIENGTSWFVVELRTKDNSLLGTGSAKNTKEAGIRAAMAALDNKELIEKYSRMRAAIPRSTSKVSLREGVDSLYNNPSQLNEDSIDSDKPSQIQTPTPTPTGSSGSSNSNNDTPQKLNNTSLPSSASSYYSSWDNNKNTKRSRSNNGQWKQDNYRQKSTYNSRPNSSGGSSYKNEGSYGSDRF